MARTCPNCQNSISANAKFCTHCGHKLNVESIEKYLCLDCGNLSWTTKSKGCRKCNSQNIEIYVEGKTRIPDVRNEQISVTTDANCKRCNGELSTFFCTHCGFPFPKPLNFLQKLNKLSLTAKVNTQQSPSTSGSEFFSKQKVILMILGFIFVSLLSAQLLYISRTSLDTLTAIEPWLYYTYFILWSLATLRLRKIELPELPYQKIEGFPFQYPFNPEKGKFRNKLPDLCVVCACPPESSHQTIEWSDTMQWKTGGGTTYSSTFSRKLPICSSCYEIVKLKLQEIRDRKLRTMWRIFPLSLVPWIILFIIRATNLGNIIPFFAGSAFAYILLISFIIVGLIVGFSENRDSLQKLFLISINSTDATRAYVPIFDLGVIDPRYAESYELLNPGVSRGNYSLNNDRAQLVEQLEQQKGNTEEYWLYYLSVDAYPFPRPPKDWVPRTSYEFEDVNGKHHRWLVSSFDIPSEVARIVGLLAAPEKDNETELIELMQNTRLDLQLRCFAALCLGEISTTGTAADEALKIHQSSRSHALCYCASYARQCLRN